MSSPSLLLLALLFFLVFSSNVPSGSGDGSKLPSSRWLKEAAGHQRQAAGCRRRPWICNGGGQPWSRRTMCCRNKCVDVSSDRYNCGSCRIRCPFSWQCCRGICMDTSINPFNCGECGRRCPFGSLCLYGMCGYAQLPPFPFPLPPFYPLPPFPPKPGHHPELPPKYHSPNSPQVLPPPIT